MTTDERLLEEEIDRVALLFSVAKTPNMRRVYARKLEELVKQRSPERAREMAKEAHLPW